MPPRLILASQSPARRQLLTAAGFVFLAEPSRFDEDQVQVTDPQALVETLSRHKAETVVPWHHEPVLVLGTDSVFVVGGEIYGKPRDLAEARHRLHTMQGQTGDLYTGHTLVDTQQQRQLSRTCTTRVTLGPMTADEIEAYLQTGEPMACAGSFALDGYGGVFIEKLEGCHSNVIGLSLPLLRQMLGELGYGVRDFWQTGQ